MSTIVCKSFLRHFLFLIIIAMVGQGCFLSPSAKGQMPKYKLADLEKSYRKKDFKNATKAALFLLAMDEFKVGEKGRTYFLLGAAYKKIGKELKAKHHFKNAMYEGYEFTKQEEQMSAQARTEFEKLDEASEAYAESEYAKARRILEEAITFKQDDRDRMEAYFILGLVTYYIQNQSSVTYEEFFRLALGININFEPKFEMGAEERRIYDPVRERYLREQPGWFGRNWGKVALGSVVVGGVGAFILFSPDDEPGDLPAAPGFPDGQN